MRKERRSAASHIFHDEASSFFSFFSFSIVDLVLGNKVAFNDGSFAVLVFTGVQTLIPLRLTLVDTIFSFLFIFFSFTLFNLTTASRGRFYRRTNGFMANDCPDYIMVG